jgi:hypothetical protein
MLCGLEEISLTGATASSCPPALASIVNVGRDTRGLSVLIIGQRPAQIPALIRDQCNSWCAFRQTRQADATAIAETFGDPEADVRRLRKYQFYRWSPDAPPTLCGPQ